MADSTIGNLPELDRINPNDLYLVESAGVAHSVRGQAIIDMVDESKKGSPPALRDTKRYYRETASGTDVPTEGWSPEIPEVHQGNFLWTKTVIYFETGAVTFYTSARQGMDGAGSVRSVMGVSPESNGDVDLLTELRSWNLNVNHPVGSVYISRGTTDPSVLFGGTWESINDKFILATGPSHSLGETGGEEEHTLTVSEIPSHNHAMQLPGEDIQGTTSISYNNNTTARVYQGTDLLKTEGGGLAHNNMPPYIALNVWIRTA